MKAKTIQEIDAMLNHRICEITIQIKAHEELKKQLVDTPANYQSIQHVTHEIARLTPVLTRLKEVYSDFKEHDWS